MHLNPSLAMSVAEIISFTATRAFLADSSLVNKPFENIKNSKGFVKAFRGFSVENSTQAYFILEWENNGSYETVTKRENFPAFLESLKPSIGGGLLIRQIAFDADATNAFSAPITEYSTVEPKAGTTQDEIDSIIAGIKEAAPGVPGAHIPLAWGKVQQSSDLHALAAGWDSVEAHLNAITVPPIDKLGTKLFEISDVTVVHLALTKA